MKYSVITLAWRNESSATPFTNSFWAAAKGRDDVELILVINGPEGQTAAKSIERPVVVELDENEGFAGGMNAGVGKATGEIFIFANLDLVFADDFFAALDAQLNETWDFLAPDVVQTGEHAGACARTRLHRLRAVSDVPTPGARVQAGNGACIVVRRRIVERRIAENKSVFETELHSFNEDIDLFWWANKRYLTIRYAPSVLVQHSWAGSFAGAHSFEHRPAEIQTQVMRNYRVIGWKNCANVREWVGYAVGELSYLAQACRAAGPAGCVRYLRSWPQAFEVTRRIRKRRRALRI